MFVSQSVFIVRLCPLSYSYTTDFKKAIVCCFCIQEIPLCCRLHTACGNPLNIWNYCEIIIICGLLISADFQGYLNHIFKCKNNNNNNFEVISELINTGIFDSAHHFVCVWKTTICWAHENMISQYNRLYTLVITSYIFSSLLHCSTYHHVLEIVALYRGSNWLN